MTAIKTANPNTQNVPAGAPLIWVNNPVNQQIVLQHVSPPLNGPLPIQPINLPAVVSFSVPNAAGAAGVVLSQQNVIDLLPSLQAFANTGVLS